MTTAVKIPKLTEDKAFADITKRRDATLNEYEKWARRSAEESSKINNTFTDSDRRNSRKASEEYEGASADYRAAIMDRRSEAVQELLAQPAYQQAVADAIAEWAICNQRMLELLFVQAEAGREGLQLSSHSVPIETIQPLVTFARWVRRQDFDLATLPASARSFIEAVRA